MKVRISFLFRSLSTIILIMSLMFHLIDIYGKRLNDKYMSIAAMKVENISRQVCLNSVNELLENSYSEINFIYEEEDVIFDTKQINLFTKDAINTVYKELKLLQKGESKYYKNEFAPGVIYQMPFSLFFNNIWFNFLSIKIPIRITFMNDVKGNILTSVEEFGINNAIINLNLILDVSLKIILPLLNEDFTFQIPLIIYSKLYYGEIPNYVFPS